MQWLCELYFLEKKGCSKNELDSASDTKRASPTFLLAQKSRQKRQLKPDHAVVSTVARLDTTLLCCRTVCLENPKLSGHGVYKEDSLMSRNSDIERASPTFLLAEKSRQKRAAETRSRRGFDGRPIMLDYHFTAGRCPKLSGHGGYKEGDSLCLLVYDAGRANDSSEDDASSSEDLAELHIRDQNFCILQLRYKHIY